MTLWHRLGRICKQWQMAGVTSAVKNGPWISGPHHQAIILHRNPSVIHAPARSFAAPVQSLPKKTEDDGPRLNEAITANYVRLVTDEGHSVVSRSEALARAKAADVDLVEVQRNTDPPVCKIMNFFKEKYKKETKEKERAKSKSTSTLRNGENKEVRFNEKTEAKDLQMKANMVTRLMERGYKVKCTVMPAGKVDMPAGKVDDLLGLLCRLLTLIDDIAVVESGPHMVETKQAYVIVRHAKFATKKSGKKAIKAIDAVMRAQSSVKDGNSIEKVMPEQIDCSSQTGTELSDSNKRVGVTGFKSIDHSNSSVHDAKKKSGEDINRRKPLHQTIPASTSVPDSSRGPAIVESNRYAKQGPKGFDQRTPPPRSESNAHARFDPKQRQFNPNNPSPPSPRYGKFIARPADSSANQNRLGVATAGKLNDPNMQPKSYGIFHSPRPAVSADPATYGKFSNSGSSSDRSYSGEQVGDKGRDPSSPTRSYGIFSSKKPVSSSDQRSHVDAEKPSNTNSATPSYGVFSSSKSAASST